MHLTADIRRDEGGVYHGRVVDCDSRDPFVVGECSGTAQHVAIHLGCIIVQQGLVEEMEDAIPG